MKTKLRLASNLCLNYPVVIYSNVYFAELAIKFQVNSEQILPELSLKYWSLVFSVHSELRVIRAYWCSLTFLLQKLVMTFLPRHPHRLRLTLVFTVISCMTVTVHFSHLYTLIDKYTLYMHALTILRILFCCRLLYILCSLLYTSSWSIIRHQA